MKLAYRLIALTLLAAPVIAPPIPSSVAHADATHTVEIVVDGGYRPARVRIPAGVRTTLRFVRRDYTPCTREVVFPTLGLRRTLPTNEPVLVELPALEPGEHPFHCGMHMIHGTLEVVAR